MKQKSKLIIIIASYLLLSTHANADNSSFNKIVNNQDLLEDEDSDWEDEFEKHSQLLKDQRDKFKHKVKKFRTNFVLESGNSYLNSGEYSKAISEYDKVIKHNPDCAEAYYRKGFSLIILRRYQEAIDNFNLAIKYKPDYSEVYYNKGIALLTLKRYQEAIENYDLAIKYKPDFSEAYNNKGFTLLTLGKYQEAINNFDLAIRYNNKNLKAYNNKGYALVELGRYQEAIETSDLVIKYSPDDADAYLEKGYILSKLNKHKEAVDNFKLVIKYQPDFIKQCESFIDRLKDDKSNYSARCLKKRLIVLKKYLAQTQEEDELETQQESYNNAIAKIQKAIIEGKINTSDSKTKALCEDFLKNQAELEAIEKEKAQIKQEMEQLRRNIDYVSSNSEAIDRKLNDLVLNAVIDKKIPGVTSKEQAVRWLNTHREEAEKITLEVAKANNIIPVDLNQTK